VLQAQKRLRDCRPSPPTLMKSLNDMTFAIAIKASAPAKQYVLSRVRPLCVLCVS
jgi:hypothetical protein